MFFSLSWPRPYWRTKMEQNLPNVKISGTIDCLPWLATLHAAQEHPEEYKDLLVRMAGYSDYFNDMNEDLQQEIIERTENEAF